MLKSCKNCQTSFKITNEDLEFLDKIAPVFNGKKYLVPSPTLCLNCRQQRRFVWRNERSLYSRKCDLCKKNIIAAYPEKTTFPVYCNQCWWSDKNDPTIYGQPYDFSKPFFDQFKSLITKVPRINLSNSNNENCDYVNYTNYSKDCYLIFGNHESEKCAYCWRVHNCLQCFDGTQLNDCKYSYNCIDCDNCYELLNSQNCQSCSNSNYLFNCRSLSNCLLCCNLVNKKYCILNEQYSKEDYQKKSAALQESPEKLNKIFQDFILKFPRKNLNIINCQNCCGDYLINNKNCFNTYSAKACQDCTNVYLAENATDCHDSDIVGWPAELCYEGISTCVNAVKNLFCSLCWTCSDMQYCDSCFNSKNLFGCTGLKQKQYCILNKQYTREEYNKLVPQIIDQMSRNAEFGEFFPITISPFSYNETIAQEYFPLSQQEAEKKDYKWQEIDKKQYQKQTFNITENIKDIPDEITKAILACKLCGKNYKIISTELDFYRKMGINIPGNCPDCRHNQRMAKRNPRQLWQRSCSNCNTPIETTFPPDQPVTPQSEEISCKSHYDVGSEKEKIFCEKCYLKTIY